MSNSAVAMLSNTQRPSSDGNSAELRKRRMANSILRPASGSSISTAEASTWYSPNSFGSYTREITGSSSSASAWATMVPLMTVERERSMA